MSINKVEQGKDAKRKGAMKARDARKMVQRKKATPKRKLYKEPRRYFLKTTTIWTSVATISKVFGSRAAREQAIRAEDKKQRTSAPSFLGSLVTIKKEHERVDI